MPPTILQASIISSFGLKYKIGVIFFQPYISFLAGAFLCTLILTGDGTPCVFQETSLVVLIEVLSFGPVTGVSSSLTHSTPVSQVKQGLNIIICCWDRQDDFFTPSHPWDIFISFWLQWAGALDLRRLLTYELRWSQWHQPWRREEECLCDLFIRAGGRLLKSTRNWGVLLPFAEVWFCAQAALQHCTPFLIRKVSLQLGAPGLALLYWLSCGEAWPGTVHKGTFGLFSGELRSLWEDFSDPWSCGKGTGGLLSAPEGHGLSSHCKTGVLPLEWNNLSVGVRLNNFKPGSEGFSVWPVVGFGLNSREKEVTHSVGKAYCWSRLGHLMLPVVSSQVKAVLNNSSVGDFSFQVMVSIASISSSYVWPFMRGACCHGAKSVTES